MTIKQTASELETKLKALEQSFPSQTSFDKKVFEKRFNAISNLNYDHQEFFITLGEFPLWIRDQYVAGWDYIHNGYNITYLSNGSLRIVLQKPEQQYQDELAQIRDKVKSEYLSDIDIEKQRLIEEITAVRLKLKQAKIDERAEIKAKADFEAELAKVQKELLSSNDNNQDAE